MGHWQIQKKACCHRLTRLSKKKPAKRSPDTSLNLPSAYPGKDALEKLGIYSQATLDRWCQVAASFKSTISVFPGLLEVIATLADSGCKLGIVSSRARDEYAKEIAPLGFDKYFEHIILVEDTTEHKPAPAPMLEYLRRAGANPGNVVYVGDTVYDEQCATSAGVSFARAAWGSHQDIPNATYNLKTPNDLLTLTTK